MIMVIDGDHEVDAGRHDVPGPGLSVHGVQFFFTSSIASMASSPSTLPMSFLDTIFGPFEMSFKSCKWGLSYY